ncbi:hypothetical protein [uncultured Mediterranean phage uvDeep-CGR2-KM18-C74]|nr:hypothetical protein [uncultured Mediterranean phage uvDeep-CGR2-KM18-C74]
MICSHCYSSTFDIDLDGFKCLICGFRIYSKKAKKPKPPDREEFRPSLMILPYIGDSTALSEISMKVLITENTHNSRVVNIAYCAFCEDPVEMTQKKVRKGDERLAVFCCNEVHHRHSVVICDDGEWKGWK